MTSLTIYTFAIAFAVGGCSTFVKTPALPAPAGTAPLEAWADVLENYVDDQGSVDFVGLAKNRRNLDIYLNYIATHGPRTTPDEFPNQDARIAHYINAYNALSMHNIIDSEVPARLSKLKRVKVFALKTHTIDGAVMSLYTYENETVRKQGDPRVHFALNCMAVSCPILPRKPFSTTNLNDELEHAARYFFSEQRNLTMDTNTQTVYFSQILDFFPEDFLSTSPSLIAYANRYTDLAIPEQYKVKFFDYDWTVNSQARKHLTDYRAGRL